MDAKGSLAYLFKNWLKERFSGQQNVGGYSDKIPTKEFGPEKWHS